MHESIGLAAGCPPHLKPRPTAPRFQSGGRFVANLGPLLPGKELDHLPQEVEVALLTRPPNPEGMAYTELEGAGYKRQIVWLVPGWGSGVEVNMSEFIFTVVGEADSCATHIAIMGTDDRVLYSGALVQITQVTGSEVLLRFDPHSLNVRVS